MILALKFQKVIVFMLRLGVNMIYPDVVTGLHVFFVNFYAMLDQGSTLSFVTHLVGRKFDVLLDVLIEPFSICTPIGDSVVAKSVYRECPIMLPNRVTLVDLVELDMLDLMLLWGWINYMLILLSFIVELG